MMNDREQLERLICERADGLLGPGERAEVDRLLAADEAAARLARQYERLRGLLTGWRALPAGVDWEAARDACAAALRDAHRDASMDELLRQSIRPLPNDVDWPAIKTRFAEAVRRSAVMPVTAVGQRPRRLAGAATLRIAIPMALAAAVTLAVWRPFGGGPVTPKPAPAKVVVALGTPVMTGRVSIHFDETAAPAIIRPEPAAPPPVTAIATSPPEGVPVDATEATVAALY